ncbi:hypothetical protein SMC26_29385 [Actinomadura fulvescens]|uniref:hypothetical protein n=1 Tax=Actinomadura fulvescens TaxID=46160 RepID=UPI0031D2D5C0
MATLCKERQLRHSVHVALCRQDDAAGWCTYVRAQLRYPFWLFRLRSRAHRIRQRFN